MKVNRVTVEKILKPNLTKRVCKTIRRLLQFARDHIILALGVKFLLGIVIGFGLGVCFLPILTAEKGLSETELADLMISAQAKYQFRQGTFVRDLRGSDRFH